MTKDEAKALLGTDCGPLEGLLRDIENAQIAAIELKPDAHALETYICALVVELHALRTRVAELEKRNV